MKKIINIIILFNFFFISHTNASITSNIISKFKNVQNLSFKFKQNINEKIETGNCIIKYPKKIYCEYNNFNKKLLVSKKETTELVDNLRENSDLSNDQTNMLGNLLQLGNVQISDVMVPRADIVSIEINKNFEETLKLFIEAAHSRLPVYKDQLDNIVGMIHVKDLLPYWNKNIEFSIK